MLFVLHVCKAFGKLYLIFSVSAACRDLAATLLSPEQTKFHFIAQTYAQIMVRVRALKAFFKTYYL